MPNRPSTRGPSKRLALFLDGTWNSIGDNTNVWRFRSLCAQKSADGLAQVTYYDIGVNGLFGGTVGKGLGNNVVDAYKWLIDEYSPGDEIFIFGFSRGAYTARSLAGFIAKYGLLKPGAALSVNQIYERYRRVDDKTIWKLCQERDEDTHKACSLEERWMLKYSMCVPIKMVAVWDTVGALGVPFGRLRGVSRSTLGFLHTGLRLPIENGFHALAIDDHRMAFAPTLWTVRRPRDTSITVAAPRSLSSVEQRWFAGAHANVGGGCQSDLLAQVPLRWIVQKASTCGLAFRSDVELDGDIHSALISDSYAEFLGGAYSIFRRRYHRPIGAPPEERSDGTHSTVNETIDVSVFDRWRADREYRPPGLMEWAAAKVVRPEEIVSSVRADDPSITVD